MIMHSSRAILAVFFFLSCCFAIPLYLDGTLSDSATTPSRVNDIALRAVGDSQNNPIPAELDCADIPQLCDANCYSILCQGKPDVL
jgi:hypothetical protein